MKCNTSYHCIFDFIDKELVEGDLQNILPWLITIKYKLYELASVQYKFGAVRSGFYLK